MSAVEMIKTAIIRIKAAKEKLKAWLASNGVTVPDGTKLDGMVEMLDDVVVGSFEPYLEDAEELFYKGRRSDSETFEALMNAMRGKEVNFARAFFDNAKITNLSFSGREIGIKRLSQCFYYSYITDIDFNGVVSAKGDWSHAFASSHLKKIDMLPICNNSISDARNIFDSSSLEEILNICIGSDLGSDKVIFRKGSSSSQSKLKRVTFYTGENTKGRYIFNFNVDIQYCSMERAEFVEMVETIPVNKSGYKITITGNPCVTGTLSDGTACDVLTDADRAIATTKGWTLVE